MQFVRIAKEDHPLQGMIGTITDETTADGFTRVTLLNSSFSGYFKPEDVQAIEKGTKVLIEVTISDFFKDSMMVAGGWMDLSRIIDIVPMEKPGPRKIEVMRISPEFQSMMDSLLPEKE
jgi:hypothetical protein